MKNLKLSILLIPLITLTSCDPAQSLFFTNNGKSNVKVKLILDSKIKNERLNDAKQGDSIVFNLQPGDIEESQEQIYFGIGTWSDPEIIETAKSIKSIEIENNDNKIIYKSQNAITKLLLKNQEGLFWKTAININIDDDLVFD